MNIAILASGKGTNFEVLAKAVKRGYIKAEIKLLITDKEKAFVRRRAKRFKIREFFINPKNFKSRLSFDKELVKILHKEKIDLVVLAGYMRILSSVFVRSFKNRILNIHPALLPAFRGTNAIERALKYGCKLTGVTVHFVNEQIDAGPIILQKSIKIKEGTALEELEKRVHELEHKLYPLAVKLFIDKKIKIDGKNVKIC